MLVDTLLLCSDPSWFDGIVSQSSESFRRHGSYLFMIPLYKDWKEYCWELKQWTFWFWHESKEADSVACFPLYSKSDDSGRGFSLASWWNAFVFLIISCGFVFMCVCAVVFVSLCGGVCFAWWCMFCVVVVVYVLFDRFLLCSPDWLWTHNPATSAFQVLELGMCSECFIKLNVKRSFQCTGLDKFFLPLKFSGPYYISCHLN